MATAMLEEVWRMWWLQMMAAVVGTMARCVDDLGVRTGVWERRKY